MRHPTVLILVSSLVLSSSLHAALAGDRAMGRRQVAIQGVTCPEIDLWSGGDPSATVVVEGTAPGGSARKHLGALRYEPIVLRAAPPFSEPLLHCIADLCTNRARPVTLLLSSTDQNGATIGEVIEATDAILSEVQFPVLDASSSEPMRVVFVFAPAHTRIAAKSAASNPASPSSGLTKQPRSSNFRITLAGLDMSRLKSIEAFILRRSSVGAAIGVDRLAVGIPGTTEYPDLALSFPGAAPADWIAWRDSFLVAGNNGDTGEKSGAIELLSPDLGTVLFSLQLSNVGLMRLADIPDKSGSTSTTRAQLYVEGMSVASGPASVLSTPATSTATRTSESTPITRKAPVEAQPAPAVGAATEPAVAAVPSPEDRGARDPADLPRPEGTVRTAFTSVRQKGSLQESAKYTANQTADHVMEFYEKNLGAGGWEEDTRYENNYGTRGAHQILSTWRKDNRTVNLTLMDTAPGSSEIQVSVQAKL